MIVRSKEQGKVFPVVPGVKFTLLQSGERMMFVLVEMGEGTAIPVHSHPHEQMGLCLKGSAQFETEKGAITVKEGETYHIAGNEKHGVSNPSKGGAVFLDVFSPPREDYLAKARG